MYKKLYFTKLRILKWVFMGIDTEILYRRCTVFYRYGPVASGSQLELPAAFFEKTFNHLDYLL